MTKFITLSFFTYNLELYYAAMGASILYFAFYVILFRVLKYEIGNKQNICNPAFYYGQACRNQIADTILSDPGFVQAKQAYYATVQSTIDESGTMTNDNTEITDASGTVQGNLDANVNFTNSTISQIQETTNVLKTITSKYLGNMQNVINSTKNQTNSALEQIQKIPPLLSNLQQQINASIVTPALMPYTDPLQKLYNSLTEVQTVGGSAPLRPPE